MLLDKVNDKLNKTIKNVKLSQAIRIVIVFLKSFYPGETEKDLYNNLIFKANPSLSFQKSDVSNIEFKEIDKKVVVEITLNFLSIFGSQSPMPSNYSEMVLRSYESDRILYDFLNLFNHHLQRFVYPIWEKHRYYVQYQKDLKDTFSRYILSFLGLRMNFLDKESKIDLTKLLSYAGLLNLRFQSANNLKSILKHYLSHKDLEIIEFIPEKYNIPSYQNIALGLENSELGENFLIGEYVVGKNNKFEILLNNSKFEDFIDYSILGQKINDLKELMNFILQEPLNYDLVLQIKKEDKKEFILENESDFYLGVSCWIGENINDEKITMIRKHNEN